MNIDILLGKTTEHLVPLEGTKFLLHKLMLSDFLKLRRDATDAGFDLQITSAFRDYNRQFLIWNRKATGEKPVLNSSGQQVGLENEMELMWNILRWSALPGSSRHHWGSDIDVFDGKNQKREDLQLISAEYSEGGPSFELNTWLEERISSNKSHGFFRPYKEDLNGVAPEAWHLSYYPVARRMVDHYSFSIFKKHLELSEIALKNVVLDNAEEIYHRFFLNFSAP